MLGTISSIKSKQASKQYKGFIKGGRVVPFMEAVGERRDSLGLGKAELLWKFHACLSLSQPGTPCKATGRTVSCGCQLPGPRGCLPRKVQPGAIWEASDILHTGAAQVGPHTGFPGPAVSLGHPAAPREKDGSRWGHCSLLQAFFPQLSQPHSLRHLSPGSKR